MRRVWIPRPGRPDVLEACEKGVVAPKEDKTFSFDEAAATHQYLQDRKNVGKVLLLP